MEWILLHRYAIALLLAGALLGGGVYVVKGRVAVAPTDNVSTWSGGTIIAPVGSAEAPVAQQTQAQPTQSSSYTYVSPFATENDTGGPTAEDDSLSALLMQISRPAGKTNSSTGSSAADAYSFIPTGFISTVGEPTTARTPTQDALYNYGNDIGNIVVGFEGGHPDQATTLKDFMEDRTDPSKIAAQKQLGADLAAVGVSIESVDTAPTQITAVAKKLAKSYEEIGAKLAAVPDASGDTNLIQAIETYDASADTFNKNFIAFALVFQSYGVTFATYDPGSVFVLQQGASL